MSGFLSLLFQSLYTVSVIGLALYGVHALWLTWRLHRQGADSGVADPSDDPLSWPTVTVQLPIYNERYVAERIIDACAQLDYPADRLEIQVLDDSDDQTRAIVQQRAAFWRAAGVDVQVVHRPVRSGYKAGALAYALPRAKGEFIAIFDADFSPEPDFLRHTIPHFLADGREDVAFVQTRWGHLNRDYSVLTRSQALALDGHFVVEQQGRQAAGFFFGFNGSGGVWRRACIEDPAVGGWQADTLCEDLDLSYRAQLQGWRPLYLNHVTAPAEVPPQLTAFKRQQFRWAKGSVQTLRKLAGHVWRSDRPLTARLFGLFHLGSYLLHPLLLLLVLVALPLMLLGADPAPVLTVLSVATIGPPLLYAVAQRRLDPRGWWRRYAYLPVITFLGAGLCVNNSLAVWQGLRQDGGAFLRTPKFSVQQRGDHWERSAYRLPLDSLFVAETFMLIYALVTAGVAMGMGKWWSVPFLLLYVAGFGTVVFVGLWQARGDWSRWFANLGLTGSRQASDAAKRPLRDQPLN
jgi:cellulose synthase/poly-beta-1,6-N-acetylglucosamine synthase-like glycosyltransferase